MHTSDDQSTSCLAAKHGGKADNSTLAVRRNSENRPPRRGQRFFKRQLCLDLFEFGSREGFLRVTGVVVDLLQHSKRLIALVVFDNCGIRLAHSP